MSDPISNLLAVIHGDGGHYEAEHGRAQACLDAEAKVTAMRAETDRLQYEIERLRTKMIEALCERIGYGAVMDGAARLWARKDPRGAFYIGGCLGRDTLSH